MGDYSVCTSAVNIQRATKSERLYKIFYSTTKPREEVRDDEAWDALLSAHCCTSMQSLDNIKYPKHFAGSENVSRSYTSNINVNEEVTWRQDGNTEK